ncbi:MAG TPA: type II toxin-antitoxin system Phd/YefM family antitoxin [Candidatus Methylomirabilis sp.]|nr:type II toxin-antitoxin system Phd/YefM family antitoxin [Candidatus Methylomirabilis sp.]
MKTLPLSEVKMKLSQLIEEIVSQDEQVTITRHGKPAAVLISPDEFDSWHETVTIRSDAQLMKEIRRGLQSLTRTRRLYSLEEVFGRER